MIPRMNYANKIVGTHRRALLPERASGTKPLKSISLNAVALVAGTRVSLTLRFSRALTWTSRRILFWVPCKRGQVNYDN